MAVFRIEKTRDYTVMSNYHLRDMSLSLKAKGLLSLMLSLPENWDYTMKGLAVSARTALTASAAVSGSWRRMVISSERVSAAQTGSSALSNIPFWNSLKRHHLHRKNLYGKIPYRQIQCWTLQFRRTPPN